MRIINIITVMKKVYCCLHHFINGKTQKQSSTCNCHVSLGVINPIHNQIKVPEKLDNNFYMKSKKSILNDRKSSKKIINNSSNTISLTKDQQRLNHMSEISKQKIVNEDKKINTLNDDEKSPQFDKLHSHKIQYGSKYCSLCGYSIQSMVEQDIISVERLQSQILRLLM